MDYVHGRILFFLPVGDEEEQFLNIASGLMAKEPISKAFPRPTRITPIYLLLLPLRNKMPVEAQTIALIVVSVMNIVLIALFAYREKQHGEVVHDLTLKLITRSTAEFLAVKEHELRAAEKADPDALLKLATEPDLPNGIDELENVTDADLIKAIS